MTASKIDINQMTNAKNIVQIAKIAGLYDVESWVTPEKTQVLIDNLFWIVFVANIPQNADDTLEKTQENKISKTIGIIAGGHEEEGRIWIELMGVSSSFRRSQIGSKLIQKLEQYARDKGYRALFVDVDTDNYIARRFYRKLGFKRAGKIKKYYYDSSATVIYCKPI